MCEHAPVHACGKEIFVLFCFTSLGVRSFYHILVSDTRHPFLELIVCCNHSVFKFVAAVFKF